MYFALLPCYNVEDTVSEVIRGLQGIFKGSIIAVDDGSTDNTLNVLKKNNVHIISYADNKGKGYAIRFGLEYARSISALTGVLLIDSDGQHNPKEAEKFISTYEKEKADVIIGARHFDKKMPFIRRVTNNIASIMLTRKCKQTIMDPLCGYKFLSKKAINVIEIIHNRYEVDIEIIVQSLKHKLTIHWVPVETHYPEEQGAFKSLPIKDVLKQIMYVWKS